VSGNKNSTVVHIAVNKGYQSVVDWIITSGDQDSVKKVLTQKDNNGDTPLHVAAATGRLELLTQLISECERRNIQSPLNIENKDGDTCLALASFHGSSNIVRYLISERNMKGVVKSSVEGWTPAHLAVYGGSFEVFYCTDVVFQRINVNAVDCAVPRSICT